ncbi:MAG: 30S ribosomal protein S20 [Myxococcaceae bacterium]|nr:30S ribosomal protein S20 [Myxococcaceae bacterium]MDX2009166.1 30S ribosomal protein S20 [Myxococcaceae bacterium]
MANTVSAAKRHRQSLKRKLRNTYVKAEFRAAIKVAREATASGDAAKAKEAVKAATRLIDRAASKGVLHAKTASRLVGRLGHNLDTKKPAAAAK